jgi:hypothetical protein
MMFMEKLNYSFIHLSISLFPLPEVLHLLPAGDMSLPVPVLPLPARVIRAAGDM